MEGEDWDNTTLVTKYGQSVFTLVLFGLSNAPGTFCRALAWVSGVCLGKVWLFLDDIVILRRGFEEHMKNMEQILSQFRDFKVKLTSSKCDFGRRGGS